MRDMIFRDDAIRVASGFCHPANVAKEIAKLPSTQQWIPVTDRLPENDDKVLCCTETKKGTKNLVIGYYMDDLWRCGMNRNVVAWMPLPAPYKGGDTE